MRRAMCSLPETAAAWSGRSEKGNSLLDTLRLVEQLRDAGWQTFLKRDQYARTKRKIMTLSVFLLDMTAITGFRSGFGGKQERRGYTPRRAWPTLSTSWARRALSISSSTPRSFSDTR